MIKRVVVLGAMAVASTVAMRKLASLLDCLEEDVESDEDWRPL